MCVIITQETAPLEMFDKEYKKYYNQSMPIDGIDWDDEKAQLNLLKHHVSFETAQYVFSDPERLERYDRSDKAFNHSAACYKS
jgi:hypothetical protein